MSGPKYPPEVFREQTGSVQMDRIQGQRDDLSRYLNLLPFLRGRAVAVELAAATNKVVTHRLGTPAAFFVIRSYGQSATSLNEATSTFQANLDQTTQIGLYAAAAFTGVLWFYPRPNLTIDLTTGQSP